LTAEPRSGRLASVAALVLGVVWATALAQPSAKPAALQGGPAWHELTNAERGALGPLQRDWPSIDAERKQKWREVAARFPNLPEDERARVQGRMSEWARMTPQERGQARLRYREAQRLAPQEREARWEAYQALSAEQRRELAKQAPVNGDAKRRASAPSGNGNQARQAKPNIVPNPAYAASPKPVAPSVVQAKPGASTTLISKRPAPPAHQQTGLPKIAAQPGFVDRETLLPQRGAQGAATRSTRTGQDDASERSRKR